MVCRKKSACGCELPVGSVTGHLGVNMGKGGIKSQEEVPTSHMDGSVFRKNTVVYKYECHFRKKILHIVK